MRFRLLAILVLFFGSGFSHAAVLTFDTIDAPNTCVVWGGSIDGFTIGDETAGFVEDPACSFLNSDGAYSPPNMMVNFNSRVGTIIKDAGTFTLNGAYFHADDRNGNTMVDFAGYDASDTLLFQKTAEITTDWQWVAFDWADIKKFTWDPVSPSTSSNVSVDDFTYDGAVTAPVPPTPAVPVPTMSAYGIALTVLVLLFFAGYRLRRTTS